MLILEQARTIIEQDALLNQKRIRKILDVALHATKELEKMALQGSHWAEVTLNEIDRIWKSKN